MAALGCVVWLLYDHLGQERRLWWQRNRITSLIGMIFFAIGFAGFAAAYFWPSQTTKTKTTIAVSVPEMNIHNLFLDDFQSGSYKMILGYSTPLYQEGRNIGEFPFEIGMYGDFQSQSIFISFYAPASNNPTELLQWFASAYKDYLYNAKKNIHIWTSPNGITQNQPISDDLVFTKKIYIYHENVFNAEQLKLIESKFANNGIDVEFRGFSYLEYRKKVGPPLSTFASKEPRPMPGKPGPWHTFTPDPTNQKQPTLVTLFMTDLMPEHGSVIVAYPKFSLTFEGGTTQDLSVRPRTY